MEKSIKDTILNEDAKKHLKGKIVIQMSTIGSQENIDIGKEVQINGGIYIECPVLGSTPAATSGNLQLLFSGPKIVEEKLQEILQTLGKIRYIGEEIGKSSVLKLALNQIIAAEMSAISVSMSMVKSKDIPIETFWNIMKDYDMFFCKYFDFKFANLNNRNHSNATFSSANLMKDVELIIDEAKSSNLETSFVEGIQKLVKSAIDNGYSNDDISSIIEGVLKHKKGE